MATRTTVPLVVSRTSPGWLSFSPIARTWSALTKSDPVGRTVPSATSATRRMRNPGCPCSDLFVLYPSPKSNTPRARSSARETSGMEPLQLGADELFQAVGLVEGGQQLPAQPLDLGVEWSAVVFNSR